MRYSVVYPIEVSFAVSVSGVDEADAEASARRTLDAWLESVRAIPLPTEHRIVVRP